MRTLKYLEPFAGSQVAPGRLRASRGVTVFQRRAAAVFDTTVMPFYHAERYFYSPSTGDAKIREHVWLAGKTLATTSDRDPIIAPLLILGIWDARM